MTKSNVIDLEGRESSIDPLTELLRTGARQLLQQANGAELRAKRDTHHFKIGQNGTSIISR